MTENQQLLETVKHAYEDAEFRAALLTDADGVAQEQGLSSSVLEAVTRLVPHLVTKEPPTRNYWWR